MSDSAGSAGAPRGWRWELGLITILAWCALVTVPLTQSPMGLSWDALNHHIYLGWIAEHSRFGQDFLAAGYQSYQFPYLYWPVYKLAAVGAGPITTGVVLATLDLMALPPVWMITRTCMPGQQPLDRAMRLLAVLLAFLSPVALSQLDSSSDDLLAAVPLVWAIALALESFNGQCSRRHRRLAILSGLCAGIAVACKLSNGPLVLMMPVLWAFCGTNARERVVNTMLAAVATVVGLIATYGYWGMLLWTQFGNPIYPFYDFAFEPLRQWAGWAR